MIISTVGRSEAQNLSCIDTLRSGFNSAAGAAAHVNRLTLPITYNGNMNIALDSVSYVDTRGLAFKSRRVLTSSSVNKRFALGFFADNGGGSPPSPVGDSILFRAYFRYESVPPIPGHNVVDTTRYSMYGFAVGTTYGSYPLAVSPGTADIHGPRGHADATGAVDIADAVFLSAYIFSGGPAASLYGGDADGNGLIDISDAVYLITYIFGGGPPPPQ